MVSQDDRNADVHQVSHEFPERIVPEDRPWGEPSAIQCSLVRIDPQRPGEKMYDNERSVNGGEPNADT